MDTLVSNSTGNRNIAIGSYTLQSNSSGSSNIVLGDIAMQSSTAGSNNIAIGQATLNKNTSGNYIAAVDIAANFSNTTGTGNTAFGANALQNNTTRNYNSAFGYNAGLGDSDGSSRFNTLPTLQYSTAIGAFAQVTQNDSIVLGSVDRSTRVVIGITSPSNLLSVSPVNLSSTSITATQSGNNVTASAAIFSVANIGEIIVWASDGSMATITGYTSATQVTVSTSATRMAGYFRTHKVGLQVASNGNVYVAGDNTSVFSIQKASANDLILTADTTNNRVKIANSTSAAAADVTLLVLDSAPSTVTPTGTAGAMYYDSTNNKFMCYTTAWGDCNNGASGGLTRTVTLVPEYAGGVLRADGTNNLGTMTSDAVSGLTLAQGYKHNYYQWTTTNSSAQDYGIIVNTALPSEYASGLANLKIWANTTNLTGATGTIQFRNNAGTICYAAPVSITPTAINTWQQKTVGAMSGCTFAANDIVTITISVSAASNAIFKVGEITFTYTN